MSFTEVGAWLDEGPWSNLQKRVLALCSTAILLDGVDIPILGLAMPALAKSWAADPSDFVVTVASGMVGMGIGTTVAGLLGDRFGRRPVLIVSMMLFGAMTMASALCHSIDVLAVLRFVAGLGLGGTLPNATAMTAEYTPLRHRTVAISLGNASSQVGGILAGLIATTLLMTGGWRALFLVGGILPILCAGALVFLLPESPRFLLVQLKWQELGKVLDHIGYPGSRTFQSELLRELRRPDMKTPRRWAGVADLFSEGRGPDTVLLWIAFFACYVAVFIMPSWLPTMLTHLGFNLKVASTGMAVYNFGGVFGALFVAAIIRKIGLRKAAAVLGLGGAAWATVLTLSLGRIVPHPALAICCIGFQGFFVIGVMVALITIAAYLYPTAMRTTGIGTALACARLGAIVSAFLGSAVMKHGTPVTLFIVIGVAMTLAGCLSYALKVPTPGDSEAMPLISIPVNAID